MATAFPRPLPVLPLRADVLLPGSTAPIPVGRKTSLDLARHVETGDLILLAVQRDPSVDKPGLADLHEIAVLARVERSRPKSRRGPHLVATGLERVRLAGLTRLEPHLLGEAEAIDTAEGAPDAVERGADDLRQALEELRVRSAHTPVLPLVDSLLEETDPALLADRAAALIGMPFEEEVAVLLAVSLVTRLQLVARLVTEAGALVDVNAKVQGELRQQVQKHQREAVLREQLKAIKKELGESGDDDDDELAALKQTLEDKELPDEVQKVVDRELGRLGRLQGSEQGVVRSYLEHIAEVPFSERAPSDDVTLADIRHRLDEDHAGLDEVKRRIVEHLAVLKVAGSTKGTVLCLAGPPGTGKTSLGRSVAEALGRPFVRVSLGGVRDEAEVRGHRRTYVGARPGRMVNAMKTAGVKNPVMLLDEIDKLGRGWAGDPEAALLEVLDPEQNDTFTDHYLELPLDLSEVLFLVTANDLSQLSRPLLDRLEIIELDGYIDDEKLAIARSHLLPQKLEEHHLPEDAVQIDDDSLHDLIRGWTREAGVRQLGRQLAKLCRAAAVAVTEKTDEGAEPGALVVTSDDLVKLLGKRRFKDEIAERTAFPGVATGLAWTPVGGDVLFIETARMRGTGKVETTGQLGDVMQESARAALTYVRSHSAELGVDETFLEHSDVHIHIPAGAVPKDGPSAGVTMFTALTSLLTGRRVRPDTAMTGEATLRGRVLPVGGIKSKVLAAHRAGLKRVVLPEKNREDYDEVPEAVREELEAVFADDMRAVIAAALEELPVVATPTPTDDGPAATAH